MSKTILIIDDEPEMREVLMSAFSHLGHRLLEAPDGATGLAMIESSPPDLIVSDYYMPGLDGLQLLAALKKRGSVIPVIWLTGRGNRELFRDAWRSGVYDFFEKPADLGQLIDCAVGALSMGVGFNVHRQPHFMDRAHYESLPLMVEKNAYLALVDYCQTKGTSIHSLLNDWIADNLKRSA